MSAQGFALGYLAASHSNAQTVRAVVGFMTSQRRPQIDVNALINGALWMEQQLVQQDHVVALVAEDGLQPVAQRIHGRAGGVVGVTAAGRHVTLRPKHVRVGEAGGDVLDQPADVLARATETLAAAIGDPDRLTDEELRALIRPLRMERRVIDHEI